MRRLRLAVCLLAVPMPLAAQEVGLGLGRFLEGNDLTYFRADLFLPKAAVVDLAPLVEYRTGEGNEGETVRFFGAGVDASIFRGAGAGPYGIVGLVGGLGSGDGDTFWGSWSLGLGWQLMTTDAVSFSAEGAGPNALPAQWATTILFEGLYQAGLGFIGGWYGGYLRRRQAQVSAQTRRARR